jgi:hypothetical protein
MVAVISGADNGSLFMPFGVLTFSRPFAILSFYRKHRDYNPNAFANNHNYTVSLGESSSLVSLGWRAEGIGWYGM